MNPQAPVPAAPQVTDAQAMAGVIGSLGATPSPDNVIDFSTVPDMTMVAAPVAPAIPAAPLPPVPPAAPIQPAAPAVPGLPQQQAVPASPDVIPLPPAPSAQDQIPSWAQAIVQQVEGIQRQLSTQPQTPAPSVAAEWTPQSWQEVEARIKSEAQSLVSAGLTQAQAQAAAETAAAEESKRQADSFIDTQVANLEKTGFLPPITNPADPADAGRAARSELYAYALSLGTDNLMAVAPNLNTLHQSGYYYDRTRNALVRRGSQSAAAQAPIAGASPTLATANANPAPTMRDLATKSLDTLAEEANRAFPLS